MRHFDLCVIGSGSGNTIIDDRFADWDVALVDGGTFGGTCLNVGCIPTKMYVYPADLARSPSESGKLGVDLELRRVHWPAIRDRIFGRIDAISAAGKTYRQHASNVTLYTRRAHFVGPHQLDVGDGEVITADQFVLAAGSRTMIPPIPGLDEVDFSTSDTVMRLADLPDSMIIIGGGYVAAEFAHVFSSFGTQVQLINRTDRLLRHTDDDIAAAFTEQLGRYVDLHLEHQPKRVEQDPAGGVTVFTTDAEGVEHRLSADALLVATGRVPNGDTLDLEATGVTCDEDGFVVVDEMLRTTDPKIWALGDVTSHHMLKHVANQQARTVQHNLLYPESCLATHELVIPYAVFSDPQVAAVGLTETQARQQGLDFVVSRQDYGGVAYGWAMEDTSHFVKVIADPQTGLILGAHLMGPMASSLIQPLIQAMTFEQHAWSIARKQYWIHPALAEVVENALLGLKIKIPPEAPPAGIPDHPW